MYYLQPAMMFLHPMITFELLYCYSSWSVAGVATLKPTESLYKNTLKTLDKRPFTYHHLSILPRYHLLNFEDFKKFKTACLIYKILHGLPPPTQVALYVGPPGLPFKGLPSGVCKSSLIFKI